MKACERDIMFRTVSPRLPMMKPTASRGTVTDTLQTVCCGELVEGEGVFGGVVGEGVDGGGEDESSDGRCCGDAKTATMVKVKGSKRGGLGGAGGGEREGGVRGGVKDNKLAAAAKGGRKDQLLV